MKPPCSKCLRARQRLKDLAALMTGQIGVKTRVETTTGELIIDNATRMIVSVTNEDHKGYIGIEVYTAGRNLVDVKRASTIHAVGTILRTVKIT